MQLKAVRAFAVLALLSGLAGLAATAPDVRAQEPCDIKVRIGDGAWSDDITLPIGVRLTIAGSNFPGNEFILVLFEPPGGLRPTIPESAITDHTGAFEDSWIVEPGYYVEGVWTVAAFPQNQDRATTDCIDAVLLTVVTTPGGLCGLAAGVDPGSPAEGRAELAVAVGQEFSVWGYFIPHAYVDLSFFVGGEFRRGEPVLADGQGYIEFPVTFLAGEEGVWTMVAGVPGTGCVAAVAVTVSSPGSGTPGALPNTALANTVAPGPAVIEPTP